MYRLNIATAQTAWAVSVADLKTHLRVSHSDDNDYITSLGKAAQAQVEAYTSRRLNAVTYDMYLDSWPMNEILLPFAPVSAVSYIKYYSSDVLTTWSDSEYETDLYGEPCRIAPADGYSWPSQDVQLNAILVRFVTGYTSIPEQFIHAIKLLVTDMYENRADAPRERFTAWKSLVYNDKLWT